MQARTKLQLFQACNHLFSKLGRNRRRLHQTNVKWLSDGAFLLSTDKAGHLYDTGNIKANSAAFLTALNCCVTGSGELVYGKLGPHSA